MLGIVPGDLNSCGTYRQERRQLQCNLVSAAWGNCGVLWESIGSCRLKRIRGIFLEEVVSPKE